MISYKLACGHGRYERSVQGWRGREIELSQELDLLKAGALDEAFVTLLLAPLDLILN
jgi:hypothetical protein